MKLSGFFTLIIVLISFHSMAQTNVMIRAKAKDAKFIGTSVGGAKILVRDALTKELLAEGVTSGSTGNTEKIRMVEKEWILMGKESTVVGVTVLHAHRRTVAVTELMVALELQPGLLITGKQNIKDFLHLLMGGIISVHIRFMMM